MRPNTGECPVHAPQSTRSPQATHSRQVQGHQQTRVAGAMPGMPSTCAGGACTKQARLPWNPDVLLLSPFRSAPSCTLVSDLSSPLREARRGQACRRAGLALGHTHRVSLGRSCKWAAARPWHSKAGPSCCTPPPSAGSAQQAAGAASGAVSSSRMARQCTLAHACVHMRSIAHARMHPPPPPHPHSHTHTPHTHPHPHTLTQPCQLY